MRDINHNWSATKQRLHAQSVAEISRHSVLSRDRIRQCETSSGFRHNPQGHRSVSVSRHFLLQAPQCPCSMRKRFSRDHCCLHRLLTSIGCKSSHNGFLDVSRSNGGLRISGWIGQLSCLTIFVTSLLSVAAFLRRAGGSMLESTGSHGRGVERKVPEMRHMVEFNCTST